MQISHGMSYFRLLVRFSNTCTFDIPLQSAANKMFREISLKSGNFFFFKFLVRTKYRYNLSFIFCYWHLNNLEPISHGHIAVSSSLRLAGTCRLNSRYLIDTTPVSSKCLRQLCKKSEVYRARPSRCDCFTVYSSQNPRWLPWYNTINRLYQEDYHPCIYIDTHKT